VIWRVLLLRNYESPPPDCCHRAGIALGVALGAAVYLVNGGRSMNLGWPRNDWWVKPTSSCGFRQGFSENCLLDSKMPP